MKKVLSQILILFIILANFFAPLSVGISKNNNFEVKKNVASAQNQIDVQVKTWAGSNTIRVNVAVKWESNNLFTKELVQVELKDMAGTLIENKEVTMEDNPAVGNNNQGGVVDFKNLNPDTQYKVYATAVQASPSVFSLLTAALPGTPDVPNISISGRPTPDPLIVKTEPAGNTTTLISSGEQKSTNQSPGDLPECSATSPSTWFTGCMAQLLYYLFFKTSSFVFGLSGKALDFTLMYSISDTSYRSSFVTEGWGIIKDFCNMFFIFVLLYIAFGTILNLHSVKTKEMIINVVIIGLLINFSLFATQVIIDASNILTRVFYNQKTIITGTVQKDASGNPLPVTSQLGSFGEIKLSEAIVAKVNPQELIMNASEVEKIPIKGTVNGETTATKNGVSTGTFIIVIFLATAINIVGTIAFLSSALIFIGRVVMLWMAMILAPLAFFSYIVPQLQDIEMIGWKKWWPDTLKMAFVAPVFAFFMYIIVGFLDKGLGIVGASLKTGAYGLNYVIAIIVPFAFLMILLMKAKDIAVKMSGEVGAAMSKAGAAVGGIALGAATGGAAFAMRGTLGAMGSKIGESEWAKKNRFTRAIGDTGKWAATKTFDARNTTLGKQAVKGMGIEGDIGKAKEGGYTKYKAEVQEKREKRAKSLELGHDSDEMHDLHAKEEALQALNNASANDLAAIKGRIDAWGIDAREKDVRATGLEKEAERQEKIAAAAVGTPGEAAATAAAATARKAADDAREIANTKAKDLEGEKARKDEIRTGGIDSRTGKYRTSNGKRAKTKAETDLIKAAKEKENTTEGDAAVAERQAADDASNNSLSQAQKDLSKAAAKSAREIANKAKEDLTKVKNSIDAITGKTINELEFEEVPEAKQNISTINSQRKNTYATEISNRYFNTKANKHAAHNIRMGAEIKASGAGH